MKLPRDLSGTVLAKSLVKHWEFEIVHQTGSHMILDTKTPVAQRISIPAHKNLRIGTLNNILRSVANHKGVSRDEILSLL